MFGRWGKEKALKYMNQEIIGYEVNSSEFRIVHKMKHSEKIIRSLLTDTIILVDVALPSRKLI